MFDSDGKVQSASPSAVAVLGPTEGRRCTDLIRAKALDGSDVCTQTCVHACNDGKPAVEVRVKGKVWRMFCAGAGDERVVLLSPTGEEVDGASSLSPREREVLGLVALGYTNARIARRLALSPATVRTHMEHILSKLNVRTRTAAVAKAMQAGLLEK